METIEKIELLDRVDHLRTLLVDLVSWLTENAITGAVYPLPVLSEAEVPPLIIPGLAEGPEAIQLTCEALARLDRLPNQHPSTVMRMPGWLQLAADPSPKLVEINALKSSVQDTLRAAFATTSTRTKGCRDLFPRVQMNQLYRHLHVIDPTTSRMSFHWQPRSTASTHLKVRQAVALLHQAQNDPVLMIPKGAKQAVAIALEHVSTLSEDGPFQLLCRTPLAPHPRVALFAFREYQALKTHHANLPLLLPPQEPRIRVRALPTFDATSRGKPRGRPQRKLETVCEIVHLYMFKK